MPVRGDGEDGSGRGGRVWAARRVWAWWGVDCAAAGGHTSTTRLGCCWRPVEALEQVVSVRDIRLFGDPVLRTPAVSVVDFDKQLRTLVQDLLDTMLDAPGAGLAAPQIGVGLRVFTYYVEGEVGHLANPRLTLSEERQDGDEGCLSIPGLTFDCSRAQSVVATGQDMYGEPVVVEGSGLLARCIQHETDHLDGVLFVDRLDAETRKRAIKAIREAEWSGGAAPVVKESPHPMFGRGL